ncbi:DUF4286 family protein [Frigoriflavimonas asaccharolytica]|uniref:DUF4286 family protein n=1 Tax=Frigoriflavimonas asaccharolytica TaxID=2735899 RepID=A0A8J8G959_9FLAO|nr:DUF4286 family protein [Frigoriflavimonas asaccharolytica]NRS91570.1 hypothetical protein [Frigoriflavimonas asaccharolytica]
MSLLSLTFHTNQDNLENFEIYTQKELKQLVENLYQVEKYYFSEVASDYITEGKNYNLLLIFDDENLREEFIVNELVNISEIISKKFGEAVIIFKTELNLQYSRI